MKEASHKSLHIVCFHLYEMCRTGKSIETKSSLVVCYSLGSGGIGAKRFSVSFWGDENVLKLTVEIPQLVNISKSSNCTLEMRELCGM